MREVPEAMGAMNRDIATRVLVIASFIKTLYIDLRYRPDKPKYTGEAVEHRCRVVVGRPLYWEARSYNGEV